MSKLKVKLISRGKAQVKGKDITVKKGFHVYGGNLVIDASQRVYFGPDTMLTCYGEVTIGHGFSATEIFRLTALKRITIGNHVLIGSSVTIIDCNHGMDPLVEDGYSKQEMVAHGITIEDGVWCGDHVIILPGVTIGQHSIIGAGSVVTKSIPPYCIAVGNPARVIKSWDFKDKSWKKILEREVSHG
ncbi:MAG: acyltransferase [Suilimivivens sp.]